MADFGWLLYVVLGALLFYFWRRVRGASFDELLERQHEEHVAVHKVLHDHPKGGDYADYKRWSKGCIA
jgi:hypothetical protein